MTIDLNAAMTALQASPIFDLLLTLLAYQIGLKLYDRSRHHPLLLPVFVGLILVIGVNLLLERSFSEYRHGAAALYVLLGPVTVALAVPLYQRLGQIRSMAVPLLLTWLITAAVVVSSAWGIMQVLHADPSAQMSLVQKAATTPIAILIADSIGGIAALAAISVMLTGIVGAMIGPALIHRMGIKDEAVLGFALGLSAHAVGTARALDISPRCGAFSALGMSLMGMLLALSLPLIFAA
ncbi:MAG: LrgB family protein [Oceanococcus sp.]